MNVPIRSRFFKMIHNPFAESFSETLLEDIDWFKRDKPSRHNVVAIYAKNFFWKFASRAKTSWPYISGDSFAEYSDIAINTFESLQSLTLKRVEGARVLFIKADLFEDFLTIYANTVSRKQVMITGNSDKEFYEIPKLLAEKDFYWFCQNSFIEKDPRVFLLPIGIENLHYGTHGRSKHLKLSKKFDKNRVLFGPMGDTHSTRKDLLEIAIKMQDVFYIPAHRVQPKKYVLLSGKYKYIFCPRGNGIDTHRFWESLYRGQSPIILESAWSNQLKELDLPFNCISSLDQLGNLAPHFEFESSEFDPKKIEELWMPYWQRKIEDLLLLNQNS